MPPQPSVGRGGERVSCDPAQFLGLGANLHGLVRSARHLAHVGFREGHEADRHFDVHM